MDHQFRPLRGRARIRRAVIEAIILLGFRQNDETIVHERPIHQLLDPGKREHDLLLHVERFVVEDCHRANIDAFPVITARSTSHLPVIAARCCVPGDLRFVERHFQTVDPDDSIVAG